MEVATRLSLSRGPVALRPRLAAGLPYSIVSFGQLLPAMFVVYLADLTASLTILFWPRDLCTYVITSTPKDLRTYTQMACKSRRPRLMRKPLLDTQTPLAKIVLARRPAPPRPKGTRHPTSG